ncbi:MAG TPA: S8 family serine peptidase [Roseiflexaceae bacterium]
MHKHTTYNIALALCVVLALVPSIAARSASGIAAIHLRRATFDPLQSTPAIASTMRSSGQSTLRLVQLSAAPDESTPAKLEAAGMRPLVYVPDNAFLVRMPAAQQPALAAVRWSGPFQLAYKLPSELDALLSASAATTETLRLLAAPDADARAVADAIRAAGGTVHGSAGGLNGATLRVQLPATSVGQLLQRDDVLWIERDQEMRLSNDQGRAITGVTTARQQLGWLTGAGQIVAVTDTGLDRQDQLSADFSGRVVAAYTPGQMSGACATSEWSDHNGHGTHVSGTVLGSGALSPSGTSFAGLAPQANLVVEAVSSGGTNLDCLTEDTNFLSKAYAAGARVQNASWGGATGGTYSSPTYGGYDSFAEQIDDYLWSHGDQLLVVAAGNQGADRDRNGVIDGDSINSPATAKNVLAVGASENNRAPAGGACATTASSPAQNYCWSAYLSGIGAPFAGDFISDNIGGIAAFSSRGPADDGRIKPEIVAPGTNVVSARSQAAGASYDSTYDANYAYESGTSMAAPMVSGAAALVRQWLAQERGLSAPSAALVKALLLNGATDISPGQYGAGSYREIPAAWPNNVEGWGRLSVAGAVQLSDEQIWLADATQGLTTGASASYTFDVTAQQPLRVTLAWTDYPASPLASKTLVNDLDLEVQAPDGTILQGNAGAATTSACQDAGADRCNNVESVAIAAPQIGAYIFRVRGQAVAHGPQPYALVARLQAPPVVAPQDAPTLQTPSVSGPAVALSWSTVSGATSYEVQRSASSSFATIQASAKMTSTSVTLVTDVGAYVFRVRGCNDGGCGPYSNTADATVTVAPQKQFTPLISQQ